MDIHKNASLTPKGREAMVRCVIDGGLSKAAAARQFSTTAKTVAKWVERFRAEGVDGLRDRSSRPLSLPSQTAPATCARVEALRRQRYTGKQIAIEAGVSAATVSRILRRLGLNRLSALEPADPVRRYEREHPGELIHIDIKKLGKFNRIGHRITGDRTGPNKSRGVGWEFVHVCIDDASRIAFSRVMKNERKASAVAFLKAAVAYYASLGVTIERVMTDNGSCYRSAAFAKACKKLGLKHLRTRPYTPRPTARPSASSKHRCANGPTPAPTTPQTNAPPNCHDGCIATIGTGLTAG
jgi:transposase InsO family protein